MFYAGLSALAALGVALSAALLLVTHGPGRALVVPRLLRAINDEITGKIELRGFRLLARGGIELTGARVLDPEGEEALRVEQARLYLDLGQLGSKVIGLRVGLNTPALVLAQGPDGLSIARAFAPRHPAPKRPPSSFDWTVRLLRLELRDGAVRVIGEGGQVALQAKAIDLDGRGVYGPNRSGAELTLRGTMEEPVAGPVAVTLAGGLRGNRLRIRTLRATSGDTALDLIADLDVVTWRGRAALLSFGVASRQVDAFAPKSPLASDLTGTAYVESDGTTATAALHVAPRDGGGSARGSLAVRLPSVLGAGSRVDGALAGGIALHATELDLARVWRGAPSTALNLEAAGRAAGRDLMTLSGRGALTLAPSRLRAGHLGPIALRVTADRGLFELSKLEARLPGVALQGRGRWRAGGESSGQATLEARDLGATRRELAALLGQPLPPLEGQARLELRWAGKVSSPQVSIALSAPRLASGDTSLEALALKGAWSGTDGKTGARLEGSVARVAAGALEARALRLTGAVTGRSGEFSLAVDLPRLASAAGPHSGTLTLQGRGALSPDGKVLTLSTLALRGHAWPEANFALTRPARLRLDPPSVDQATFASGAQRVTVAGGMVRRGRAPAVAAHLSVEAVDLGALLRPWSPRELELAGRLDAQLGVTGAAAAPDLTGSFSLREGAIHGLRGLSLQGAFDHRGARERARFALALTRAAGGALKANGELPLQRAGAPRSSPLSVVIALQDWPLAVLREAGAPVPRELEGVLAFQGALEGTVGEPRLTLRAGLGGARWADLEGLALELGVEAAGREAHLTGALAQRGARVLTLDGRVPVVMADVVRAPARIGPALLGAPLRAVAEVPGYELEGVAGHFGVPPDARGRFTLRAEIGGSAGAPRGEVRLGVKDGAVAGYAALEAEATLAARRGETSLAVRASMAGEELIRGTARMALPLERLGVAAARENAPIEAQVKIARADLRRAGTAVPLSGEVSGGATLTGTLVAPRFEAALAGRDLRVDGHPLGELALKARRSARQLQVDLHLGVTRGGALDGALEVDAQSALPAMFSAEMGRAPARARLVAKALDLGFLPAVMPGSIRAATGKLEGEVTADGPLARMTPRGTLHLAGGRLDVVEWGDWSDLAFEAVLSRDALRVERLTVRRGAGRVEAKLQVSELARVGSPATLTGEVRAVDLAVPRAGQVLATVDLESKFTGTASREALRAEVSIAAARVKMPDRSPRAIQSLEARPDIVIAPFGAARREKGEVGAGAEKPYVVAVHVLAPNNFRISSDNPLIDVELRADVQAELEEGNLGLSGVVQTLRGRVEPTSGRNFDIKRGRVEFTGAGYEEGQLEVQALNETASYKVTVAIGGTVEEPKVKLSSVPALDEAQIALLLATGRTELKAGTGGVSASDDPQALGYSAVGALSGFFLKDVLGDKLPVDTVSVDSSQLRAGKYVTSKIYVGYTFRRDARTELGENRNEVRGDYQISSQWNFELRYGDANSGGASLIWSKDY